MTVNKATLSLSLSVVVRQPTWLDVSEERSDFEVGYSSVVSQYY